MAITDTANDRTTDGRSAGADAAATGLALPAPSGVLGVIGSGDHKTIGRTWIAASGVFGAGSLALLMWYGIEAAGDAAAQTDRAFLNFTLGVLGLVLGFIVPLFVGLATTVVPLQVGAATIAFPRAAAAALWGWLLSGVLLAVSYLPGLGGGVGGPEVDGSLLTYLALIGLVASLLLGTVCVMTTVVTLRPAGMTLDRVPGFCWSMLVAGGVWLLTLPVLAANALFVIVDLEYGSPALFGVREDQWTQFSWIVLPPQVFAWAIPALGIVADIVTTFARGRAGGSRQPQRGVLLGVIGVAGALAFGAYVQPAFDPFAFRQWAYIAQVATVVLPLLILFGLLGLALRPGVAVTGPLVLGLVSLVLLVIAAVAGVLFVVGPLDLQTTSGDLIRAVPALTLATAGPPVYTWGVLALAAAAAVAGAVAGLFHWASKIAGRQLPAGLGKLLAPVLLVAGLLAGVPFLVLGFANKADGLVDAAQGLIIVSLVGVALTLVTVVVAVAATFAARLAVGRGAACAEPDAWGSGVTLEWATESPPAPGNFGVLAEVTSSEPLVDAVADGGAR